MKKIYKLFLVTVLLTGAMFQSCETTELELVDNPNGLTEGDPQFLLNSVQSAYRAAQVTFNDNSSQLTRIDNMFGRNYFAAYNSATMNGPWGNLYSSMLPDMQAIAAAQSETLDLSFHLGISKIMQAHIMMQLVDFIGNIVPMDQATNPIEFPNPEVYSDGGTAAYASALAILDEAIALLSTDPPSTTAQDLFYDGDSTKWIKLANTLKMRAAMTTGDATSFNAIVADDNFIDSTADDLQFNFGTQLAPVNTQHQDYQNDYTSSGANIYQSTWLMKTMLDNNDPRIRYYFFRQDMCTPGASCLEDGNGETLSCSLQSVPTHLQGTPCGEIWCFMEEGYWGRTHGNDEGTPPDNFTRTAAGIYPAGGNFDDDRFSGVALGQSSNGAGIEPIILASYVDFWRAEMALSAAQPGPAAIHLTNGLTKSIAKVQSFIALDGAADTDFEPSGDDVTLFINTQVAAFSGSAGDDQWNVLGNQYFVTLFGGGADAHNFYRRTGYPNTVCPNIDPNPGNYPRTFLYPQNEVVANPNIAQRTNNDEPVFWNTQPLPTSN